MRSNPQRLAWITLLGALALFCLLCVSSVIFARWLLFESPTQLSVTLHVARGTVGVSKPDTSGEQAVRTTDTVGQENTLSTDNDSQGYLAFADPYSGQVLATVTLHHDSVMTLDRASRPRFSLSDNPYSIRVTGIAGRVDVWVNGDLDRELRLDLVGPLGTILVSEPGTLFVESTADFQTVTARRATARPFWSATRIRPSISPRRQRPPCTASLPTSRSPPARLSYSPTAISGSPKTGRSGGAARSGPRPII